MIKQVQWIYNLEEFKHKCLFPYFFETVFLHHPDADLALIPVISFYSHVLTQMPPFLSAEGYCCNGGE